MILKREEWSPSDGIKYREDSPEINAIMTNKNSLLSAGPGAGKTELLAQKAAYLFQTNTSIAPRKILALSFKVDAAQNIKDRVDERCGDISKYRFVSMTYDKFFKMIFDKYLHLLPSEFTVESKYEIQASSYLRSFYSERYKEGYTFNHTASEYKYVPKIAKNYLENYYLFENKLPLPSIDAYVEANIFWKIMLKGEGGEAPHLSFKMITRLAELLIERIPYLKESLRITYSHLFLDEFQDTNLPQYSAIKSLFYGSATQITAVGDEKQRIMLWAGAKKDVFDTFIRDFSAEKIIMYCNHRSAPNLINVQKRFVKELTGKELDIVYNEKWSEDDGEYSIERFKDEELEANWIVNHILKALKSKGVLPNEICILTRCKVSEYSKVLIDKLQNSGVKARVEDEYQTLLREPIVKILLAFTEYSIKGKSAVLWNNIYKILKSVHGDITSKNNDLMIKHESLRAKDISNLTSNFETVTDLEEFQKRIEKIIEYLSTEKLILRYPQYRNRERINQIVKRYAQLLWCEYENYNDWNVAIDGFSGKNSIPVMSIHKSKGLEYKIVFLLALEGSSFFAFRNNYSEELSNIYVALSRAEECFIATISEERLIEGYIKYAEEEDVIEAIELLSN